MIDGEIRGSILQEKALQYGVRSSARASHEVQLNVYRETLVDLEEYLDVGDLRRVTAGSLEIIRDDILGIIDGMRALRSKVPAGTVKSMDGALDRVRKARNELQVAIGLFDASGNLKETKSKVFFQQMEKTRQFIEAALGWLG